ncbi:MAG: hypothetical protein GY940_10340 [bacterium]|nr:hypothetical protein [bacterium]
MKKLISTAFDMILALVLIAFLLLAAPHGLSAAAAWQPFETQEETQSVHDPIMEEGQPLPSRTFGFVFRWRINIL